MKNKRGDIPVMILVFGVFAICGLAILSFIIFDERIFGGGEGLGVEVIEELNSDIEKFYFYRGILGDDNKAAEIIGVEIHNGNQLIIKKSNDIISITYTKSL